jgi:hypothetical protein
MPWQNRLIHGTAWHCDLRYLIKSAASSLCLSGLNGAGTLVYQDACVPGGQSLGWQLWQLQPVAAERAVPWAPVDRTYQIVSAMEGLCLQVRACPAQVADLAFQGSEGFLEAASHDACKS